MDNLGTLLHPSLLVKKAVGKLRRKTASVPTTPVITLVNGVIKFETRRLPFLTEDNQLAMMMNSYDLILQAFLKKHLRPGDTVLDGGANVGYISAVAASFVGPTGEVHSFEPLKECYDRCQVIAKLNPDYHFFFNNAALGDQEGILPMVCPEGDARNSTLVGGKDHPEARQVPVKRLDDYIAANVKSPEKIRVIKLDVQGFEYLVLRGLERYFSGTSQRPVIACDMKPWEMKNIGHTLEEFERYMKGFGYRAYDIVRENTPVDICSLTDWTAVVFKA
ncbi:MAG TPA: FkbM family methyltransferase [Bryobacteraceae bacterium]|jgi:FkbM family methyltransferase